MLLLIYQLPRVFAARPCALSPIVLPESLWTELADSYIVLTCGLAPKYIYVYFCHWAKDANERAFTRHPLLSKQ
jgi:hypothetical protein